MAFLSIGFLISKESFSPEVIFTKSNAYHNIMIIEDKENNRRSFLQNF
jgi:hypothetical protein